MNQENTKFYKELKKKRNTKKITLEEISEYTKINIKYLDAIEIGDFNSLPNVYIRLFLRSYCDYIGCDYKKALDEYEIYTIGDKRKNDIDNITIETSNDQDSIETSNIGNNISSNLNNYKELIIASTVITIIIILFIILNLIN